MENFWQVCMEEARLSYQHGDVPIGAVIVQNGQIIAHGHNTREIEHNIMGHAEINAILEASKSLKRWNLHDCELYVSLEPCSMCKEIIKQSRIDQVYYLLDKLDYKKEYAKTKFDKYLDFDSKNKQMYKKMLSQFFAEKR